MVVGVLILVFGIILPRFVDYDDVIAAFRDLTLPQFLLMLAVTAVAWVVSGLLFCALIPGVSPIRGTIAYLILSGIGASVPFGPWNMGVVWVVFRRWGVAITPATSGIALYGLIGTLSRLAMPLVAAIVLLITGASTAHAPVVTLIALISITVLIVAVAVILAVVGSDRAADWVARTGQRLADWVLAKLGRHESPDVGAGIRTFRDQLGDVIRGRGLVAGATSLVGQLTWTVILIIALRVVGIPEDVISPTEVLVANALVSVITIIPIAPGGAGIPELLYIAIFTAIAGDAYSAVITAGVFLFRLYQWFLPIPLAWILLKVTRRGVSILPTGAELKAYASDVPA